MVSIREKKKASNPTMIAPIILVAAKENAKRMMANKITPKMLASKIDNVEQTQWHGLLFFAGAIVARRRAR